MWRGYGTSVGMIEKHYGQSRRCAQTAGCGDNAMSADYPISRSVYAGFCLIKSATGAKWVLLFVRFIFTGDALQSKHTIEFVGVRDRSQAS
jgi:hypothetical protein